MADLYITKNVNRERLWLALPSVEVQKSHQEALSLRKSMDNRVAPAAPKPESVSHVGPRLYLGGK